MPTPTLTGVFPIAPTPFSADEALDLDGQRRVIDFLVDAGVDGVRTGDVHHDNPTGTRARGDPEFCRW